MEKSNIKTCKFNGSRQKNFTTKNVISAIETKLELKYIKSMSQPLVQPSF